ncbi:MAG: bacillithiol system redox-active protein YtxJ [Crocinitomicaceae bacterium]|nr:bacillithiol system redox-active protein YtxJ [Crocinitomicaceae bacterium]
MGLFTNSTDQKNEFSWIKLENEEQLKIAMESDEALFIFKHSTRCPISVMAKSRFEREWTTPDFPLQLLYLDLLNYRDLSNKVAELTGVVHESPQLIVVKNKQVLYVESHNGISAQQSIQKAIN